MLHLNEGSKTRNDELMSLEKTIMGREGLEQY